jgi:hypothetical protein
MTSVQSCKSNSQLYGFNNSSIGKICLAKCEAENEQIIIIQGIYNLQEKKLK